MKKDVKILKGLYSSRVEVLNQHPTVIMFVLVDAKVTVTRELRNIMSRLPVTIPINLWNIFQEHLYTPLSD